MFTPSKNISRYDTIQSIAKRFNLQESIVIRLLNCFYPVAFWSVLSVEEYQKFVKQLLKPTDKNIISILGNK